MKLFYKFGTRQQLYIIGVLSIIQQHVSMVTATECTRACRIDDKDLTCWLQSLKYFTETLQNALNEYSGTLIHLQKWKIENPEKSYMLNNFVEVSLNTTLFNYNEDSQIPLTVADMLAVFDVIIKRTRDHDAHYSDREVLPPRFTCPIPCEYYPKVWSSLTFVLLSIVLLLSLSVCLYVCQQQRSVDNPDTNKNR